MLMRVASTSCRRGRRRYVVATIILLLFSSLTFAESGYLQMTAQEAAQRSAGCVSCHAGIEDMHNGRVNLGCADCHGGNAMISITKGAARGSREYTDALKKAHVAPRDPDFWKTSANPPRSYTKLNQESEEFIRFMN